MGGGTAAQTRKGSPQSFDTIAQRAAQASAQNRLAEATQLYRQALAMRPNWAEGWWSLGTLLYDKSEYVKAARAFQKVVTLDAKNGTARVMLGLCQFELGQDDNALKNLQTGRQLGVVNVPQLRHVMLYHEGILLLRKGLFGSAQDTLARLARDSVQDQDLSLALGMTALRIRPADLPEKGTPGRDVVSRTGSAEALASRQKFDEAKQAYSSLVREYPDYANLHYAYGRFLLQMHDTSDAVEEFKRELKIDPEQVNALLEIAAVRYRVDSAEGVKYAEQAVKLAPQLPFAHYLLGLLYLDTGHAAEAIPQLEIARRVFDREPSVYYALGTAYARVGRKKAAAQARKMFVRLQAIANTEAGPMVYGEQASGLSPEKFRTSGASPRPH
jgi:tetratricopeptide (TPR) repeat protein